MLADLQVLRFLKMWGGSGGLVRDIKLKIVKQKGLQSVSMIVHIIIAAEFRVKQIKINR